MLMRFVRFLMPREERFVDHFADHAERLVAAAKALTAMMDAAPDRREACFNEVCTIEGQADAIAREAMMALHRAFITPFDRSVIHTLVTALDDAVDLIEEVGQRAQLYQIEKFSPRMRELAVMTEEAGALLVEVIPMLTNISKHAEKINATCQKVGAIESRADSLLRQALSELIANPPATVVGFLGLKEVYELLETVTDRCDDVADIIVGIVLDHV
ncbi:MAG: DUF47 domain-containing protein [Magnetospirillum sp.]|nr:DUF47 domain-containing protein [Magnetospirillum sp.]